MNSIKETTQKVTDGIIKCLEAGTIPWKSGMTGIGMPVNYDGKAYYGMNRWVLAASVIINEFPTNTWITFNRCKKEGGHVLKGQKATTITFWKFLVVDKVNKDGETVDKTIPFLRTFNVFNLAQTSLYDPKSFVAPEPKDVNVDMAEQLIGSWDHEVAIRYGYDNMGTPYYAPSADFINIPFGDGVEWTDDEWLHKTTFHEMMHSTGHKSRLDRFDNAVLDGVDADKLHARGQYSAEELVAEMGSQILSDICGFQGDHLDNTAAYINSWIKCLKSNPDWILWASSRAEKGVDMILDEGGAK